MPPLSVIIRSLKHFDIEDIKYSDDFKFMIVFINVRGMQAE